LTAERAIFFACDFTKGLACFRASEARLLTALFLAGALRAIFFAGAFFAGAFFAGAFLATFLGGVFFFGAFLAGAFLATFLTTFFVLIAVLFCFVFWVPFVG